MNNEDREEFTNMKNLGRHNNEMLREIKTAISGDSKLGIVGLAEQQKKDNEFRGELQTYIINTGNILEKLSEAALQNTIEHKKLNNRLDPIERHYNASKTVRNWLIAAMGIILGLAGIFKILQHFIFTK